MIDLRQEMLLVETGDGRRETGDGRRETGDGRREIRQGLRTSQKSSTSLGE